MLINKTPRELTHDVLILQVTVLCFYLLFPLMQFGLAFRAPWYWLVFPATAIGFAAGRWWVLIGVVLRKNGQAEQTKTKDEFHV